MTETQILKEFDSCFVKIQTIIQSPGWQQLVSREHAEPEMKTHLGGALYYLDEAMGIFSKIV